jgi:hypothetical protein
LARSLLSIVGKAEMANLQRIELDIVWRGVASETLCDNTKKRAEAEQGDQKDA